MDLKIIDEQIIYLFHTLEEWEPIVRDFSFNGIPINMSKELLEGWVKHIKFIKSRQMEKVIYGLGILPSHWKRKGFWIYCFYVESEIYYRTDPIYPECPKCKWRGLCFTRFASDSMLGIPFEKKFTERYADIPIKPCPCCGTNFERCRIIYTDTCEGKLVF